MICRLFLIGALITNFAWAQTNPICVGEQRVLKSSVLGQDRILNIYLPDEYANDSVRCNVIYLLDGSADEDFLHIVGLVQFFQLIFQAPPAMVVGIANIDRKHDLSFPTTVKEEKEKFPTTGGSANFHRFIETELQPFIEKNYRTTSSKTLIGQSLGGLFAAETLLKYPQLFNRYIIVSPSVWWNNESIVKDAPLLWQKSSEKSGNPEVFFFVGREGAVMINGTKKLWKLVDGKAKASYQFMPAEDHATILHQAVYKAFETIYHDGKLK